MFTLRAEDVLIVRLTRSDTGAMSRNQSAAIQRGDEPYAGSPSYVRSATPLVSCSRSSMSCRHTRGRAAEKILFA